MKKNNESYLFTQDHPDWLLARPKLLILVYLLNSMTQLRKWYIIRPLSGQLKTLPDRFSYLDIGCGEGQFLFPYARVYPKGHFTGLDKNGRNIELCRRYARVTGLKNTTLIHSTIGSLKMDGFFHLAVCVGVLQYIHDDRLALERIFDSLLPGGTLFLYVPVTNRSLLPFYPKLMNRYSNYEGVQGRKRIYTETSVRSLLATAGFNLTFRQATYGSLGILSNEWYNLCLLLMVHSGWLVRVLVFLVFVAVYPLFLLCMLLDFLLPVRNGNGLLLIAKKPGSSDFSIQKTV
jgi:SAM-dependent methyltransferase